MKIKNMSKIPIEFYDGAQFVRILSGESKDVDGATVRRRKLIERGLAVSEEPAKQPAPVQSRPDPVAAPAYKQPARAKLDESDA